MVWPSAACLACDLLIARLKLEQVPGRFPRHPASLGSAVYEQEFEVRHSSTHKCIRWPRGCILLSCNIQLITGMAEMLRVWRVSGEEVAALPMEDLTDVASLKQRLQGLCRWPRSMQKLLHNGTELNDDEEMHELDPPVEVQLVLLPFDSETSTSQDQLASALVEAAADGELDLVTQLTTSLAVLASFVWVELQLLRPCPAVRQNVS